MEAMKEKAANVAAASAKAGLEKTKATVQEKVEKLSAHDEMEKRMVTQRKDQKMAHYSAGPGPGPGAVTAGTTYSVVTGVPSWPTGPSQMSALPRTTGGAGGRRGW